MGNISKIIMLLVFGIVFVPTVSFAGDHSTRSVSAGIYVGGKELRWNRFVINASEGWYRKRIKNNADTLTLYTKSIDPLEKVVLSKKVLKVNKHDKKSIVRKMYRMTKNSQPATKTTLYMYSKYTVMEDDQCALITSRLDRNTMVYTFLPYINGKLYSITTISTGSKRKKLSPRVKKLLKNISLDRNKKYGQNRKYSKIPFSDLDFEVSIKYTKRALRILRAKNEKVKVWVIVDQFGKQYMEEEGVASAEVIINPGEKAVFNGVPLRDRSHRYKSHKRYKLTIMIMSARYYYPNNILNCWSEYGTEYDIKKLDGKRVEFECKLN